jgi:hypothetical protein
MEKEFIPYEQALALKELGFDEPCIAFYEPNNEKVMIVGVPQRYNNPTLLRLKDFCAPTYSQAFRWFREKYSWQHSMEPTADQHRFEVGYNYWIWNSKTGEEYHTMPKNRPTGDWEYETYEESELECLKKLIEIVKNK